MFVKQPVEGCGCVGDGQSEATYYLRRGKKARAHLQSRSWTGQAPRYNHVLMKCEGILLLWRWCVLACCAPRSSQRWPQCVARLAFALAERGRAGGGEDRSISRSVTPHFFRRSRRRPCS